jgi:tetratricopeptide (TPR) repeat protein
MSYQHFRTNLIVAAGVLLALCPASARAAECTRADSNSEPSAMEAVCTPIIENRKLSTKVRADAYGHRGYGRYRGRNYEAAIEDYDNGLRLAPNNPNLHRLRGVAFMDMGDCVKAISAASKSVEIDPTVPNAFLVLAKCYGRLGQPDAERTSLNRVIALDPKDLWARNQRAELSIQEGRVTEALDDTSAMMAQINDKHAKEIYVRFCTCTMNAWAAVRLQHALVLGSFRRVPEGDAIMNQLVANERSFSSHFARALYFTYLPYDFGKAPRLAEAIADGRIATSFEPKNIYAWRNFATNLLQAEDSAAALAAADTAIENVAPNSESVFLLPELYWLRALSLRNLGRQADAKESATAGLVLGLQISPGFASGILERMRARGYWNQAGLPDVIDEKIELAATACMIDKGCW